MANVRHQRYYCKPDSPSESVRIMKLEHIGIAVADIESTKNLLKAIFGAEPYKQEVVASEGVITHFYDAGGVKIELLEATSTDSAISKFILKHGQGLHHLAFSVDHVSTDFERIKGLGIQVLGEAPKQGADGKWIFFAHPRDTSGVLMEFCSEQK